MDVANGDLEWKHAAVQMGVSAATSGVASGLAGTAYSAASPYASQAVTMAASGIDYEAGGGIGWSGDDFKAGIKRGMVNMAMTAAGGSFSKGMSKAGYGRVGTAINSGASSFVNSGLDVDNGSWWRIGWKEEGAMDHVMAGIASATASAATYSKTGQNPSKNTKGETTNDKYNYEGDFSQEGYNNKLLYNTINSGMLSLYNMAAHDLSREDASRQSGFYSGMLYDHKDVGGRLGQFVGTKAADWTKETYKQYEAEQKAKESGLPLDGDAAKDPLNDVENLLMGMFHGLKKGADWVSSIGQGIKNKFLYPEFGSDDDFMVQRARVKAQLEDAGYQLTENPESYFGQRVVTNDGKVIQVGYDKEGLMNASQIGQIQEFGGTGQIYKTGRGTVSLQSIMDTPAPEEKGIFGTIWQGVKNITGFGKGGLWEKAGNLFSHGTFDSDRNIINNQVNDARKLEDAVKILRAGLDSGDIDVYDLNGMGESWNRILKYIQVDAPGEWAPNQMVRVKFNTLKPGVNEVSLSNSPRHAGKTTGDGFGNCAGQNLPDDHKYVTQPMAEMLVNTIHEWNKLGYGESHPIFFNDFSLLGGVDTPYHLSHMNGMNADIKQMFRDGKYRGGGFDDHPGLYDVALTAKLGEVLITSAPSGYEVYKIKYGDKKMIDDYPYLVNSKGRPIFSHDRTGIHDDHYHLQFRRISK